MLGKLLKYDMKRQLKLLAAAYLVVGCWQASLPYLNWCTEILRTLRVC